MRTNPTQTLFKSIALALLLSTLNSQLSAFAQGTAFTYQGRLSETGNLANGTYDFLMSLWNAGSGGSRVTSASNPLVITGVAVSNGLFTVMLDFGDGVFTGPPRWLEIAVNTNGASSFATLRPRQPLTAAPYATTAGNVTGVVPAGSIGGTYTNGVTFNNSANSFTGSGASLSSVNAVTVGGIASSNIWRLGGNS
ncbi:MAG TPA: hypothetical protein VKM56_15230, partial [Verrucomicrobiae bacterium]|nr:hypothetical protein [Verrucomicrobiae bacterium]